jgi:hypothetical protein
LSFILGSVALGTVEIGHHSSQVVPRPNGTARRVACPSSDVDPARGTTAGWESIDRPRFPMKFSLG